MTISLPIVSSFDNRGIRQAQDAVKKFGSIAADIAKIGAAAIAGVGVAGVREFAQFETSIAKIEGLVGVAGAELDKLTEAARRLGPETGKSAQSAADALFVITSAGLRGADAIDALEFALKASTAGLGETQDIARAVAGALNAYGTEVIDAAKATDVIVATARAGNFETSQFAAAICRVLPFAQQAGASLEDMGGAVALLTRTNGDAAQSVTQVAALFRAFVVPTEQAKKALDNVGLSAQDMRDAIASQGLPAALDMLDEKLGGNREELGRLLGSSEAASAAFQILEADNQTLAETFGVVNDAAGITEEAFATAADTAQFKFNQAMGNSKEILLGIGEDLLERLLPYLDRFNSFMEENGPAIRDAFDDIFEVVDRVAGKVGDFVAELQADPEFVDLMGRLGEIIKNMIDPATDLALELAKLAVELSPVLKDAASDAGGAVANLLTILNNIVASVRILTGTMPEASDEVDEFGASWTRLIPVIGAWLGEDGLLSGIADWTTRMRERLEEERPMIEAFWNNMAEVFSLKGEEILEAIVGTFERMKEVFSNAWNELFGITSEGMNEQERELTGRGPVLNAIGSGLMTQFQEGILAIWPTISEWFATRGDAIKEQFGNAKEILLQIGKDIIEGLRQGLISAWDAVARWVREKVNWIKDEFKKALKIKSPSGVFFEYGENIVQGLVNGMESLSPRVDVAMGRITPMPSMSSTPIPMGVSGGGGSVYNITVNAGIGTDGPQVAEQIVRLIRRYERNSGPVFARA